MITETKCSDHPDAPHGFVRNASHSVGHYVCECSGWTPPASIQEELRSVPERSRTTLEAADRIDLDAAHIDTLAKVVDKLQTERDEYRKCADDQAMAHKIERDALMSQVAALTKVIKPALAAMNSVDVNCENFHHRKKDLYHEIGECKPRLRYLGAFSALDKAMKESK